MGDGLSWICPNCGYEFSAQLGFGFRYPWVCHQLIQKARAGAYGAEWQDLVETYPGTFLEGDLVLLRCENCGSYDNEALLTAYIPKDADLQAKPIPRNLGKQGREDMPALQDSLKAERRLSLGLSALLRSVARKI